MTSNEKWLIPETALLRPKPNGSFDELVIYGEMGECIVHAEMMDDKTLWIGFYPPGDSKKRVVMWISAKGKLSVRAEDD